MYSFNKELASIPNGTKILFACFPADGHFNPLTGLAMYLKEKNSAIQIVGCQPTEESSIPGIRRWAPAYLPR